MNNAMSDQFRPLAQSDLLEVFKTVIPTSKTKKTEIETMRTFVENGMMQGANDTEEKQSASAKGSKLKSFNWGESQLDYYILWTYRIY